MQVIDLEYFSDSRVGVRYVPDAELFRQHACRIAAIAKMRMASLGVMLRKGGSSARGCTFVQTIHTRAFAKPGTPAPARDRQKS